MFTIADMETWAADHATELSAAVTGIATIVVAVFTRSLAKVTSTLASITKRQHQLEQARFAAEHQPKLIVYGFRWKDREKAIKGGRTGVFFNTVNVGRQDGALVEIGTKLQYSLPASHPPGSGIEMRIRTSNLPIPKIGSPELFGTDDRESYDPDSMEGRNVREKKWALYCLGYIAYVADDGTPHRTGFCQKYNPDTWRWEPFNDPEYVFAY